MQAAIPEMLENGGGASSSTSGAWRTSAVGPGHSVHYAAAKGAVGDDEHGRGPRICR